MRHILCTRCPRTFQSHSHFKHHINSDHGGVYMKPEMLKFKRDDPEAEPEKGESRVGLTNVMLLFITE